MPTGVTQSLTTAGSLEVYEVKRERRDDDGVGVDAHVVLEHPR